MPSVLICAPDPLTDELLRTLIGRDDVERRLARRFQDAILMAVADRPDLVVVDSVLSQSDRLVEDLRLEASTASVSIVVIAREHPAEGRYAGANAVLRLPAGPEWDERLSPLLFVPNRRAQRLAVELPFEAAAASQRVLGTVLNVSETGVLVETDAVPALHAELELEIRLSDGHGPVIGRGVVVRHDGPHRSGVKFASLDADGLLRVRRMIVSGNGD
jgi:DNA-binding response OmpR family regulator